MFRKNSILVMLLSGLFLSISVPFSNAGEGVGGTPEVVDSTNVSGLVGVGSEIVIDVNTLDVESDAYTFSGFDAVISSDLVPDPESYVLDSTGILLQPLNELQWPPAQETNSFTTALEALVEEKTVISANTGLLANVTDAAGLSFNFTAGEGHNTVSLDFILASGEYYGGDWDVAGIFINGTNFAFLPNGKVLRVNTEAQISNVCSNGFAGGCLQSDYTINEGILGTLSPKLTVYAPIYVNSTNTFSASVANTDDNYLPSYLLLSNFQSYFAEDITASSFTLVEEVFNYGIQIEGDFVETPFAVDSIKLNQSSEITGISASTADANNNVTIIVTGKFIEEVRAIDVNDRRVSPNAWKQTSTSITLTVPAVASGIYAVQIWNGSFPVLQSQTVVVTTK